MTAIPTIDLTAWHRGTPDDRARISAALDEGLARTGFFLVTGHGVDLAARARIRTAARRFFLLPDDAKHPYAVHVGGRGWLGPGAEANAYAEGTASPPDLKESFSFAADDPTGDPAVDAEWFLPNIWPDEVPELQGLVTAYLARMRDLSDRLLDLLGTVLCDDAGFFSRHATHPTWGFNINWYPGPSRVGPAQPGQFRIGPHTDFGTVTVLDREHGSGGLQVHTDADGWRDAPYDPTAFTINVGDLMARWTDGRWRAGRHRVLAAPANVPDEELMSLVYFHECNPGTDVRGIDSHKYLRSRLDAISAKWH